MRSPKALSSPSRLGVGPHRSVSISSSVLGHMVPPSPLAAMLLGLHGMEGRLISPTEKQS